MTISPDVSIIIPHLNQNDALEKCINSLQLQSYPLDKIEIIIVDNGSKLLPLLSNTQFKNFVVMQELECGPGPARNSGVRKSSGEYLFFIDADCTADNDWVKNGILALAVDGVAILGGDVKITENGLLQMTAIEAYENVFAYRQEFYINKMGFSGSGNLAIRRGDFYKVGFFPGLDVAEDRAWGAQALRAGFKFTYRPEMIIYHPARESFKEIFDKWARHSRHDFADLKYKSMPLLRWTLRSFIVLASIPVHCVKVLTSKSLNRTTLKLKAILALVIIRLFRVWFMMRMIFSKNFRNQDVSWNKE